jgi:ceramide glucosyltransferase
MPCKGLDPGFDANIASILQQDYPDYEVLLVTATQEDPAYARLRSLLGDHPAVKARLLVAGVASGRSQKLNNQLCAWRQVRPDTQALVFVDSDVRAHPQFLRALVAPLSEDGVGASTGFRWYVPETGGFGSYLRATWNGGGLPLLAQELRTTYERAGVAQRWESALTDDFPLTRAVRALGLSVRLVPQCLLCSHEDSTLAQTLEWTNRQTLICRVYDPPLWRAIFAMHAVHSVAMAAGLGVVIAKVLRPDLPLSVWPGVAVLGVIPVEMAGGALLWRTVSRLLPGIGGRAIALKHIVLVPAAILLIFYNSIHSLTTRDLCWRGVRYRLHSPSHTEVLGAGPSTEPQTT